MTCDPYLQEIFERFVLRSSAQNGVSLFNGGRLPLDLDSEAALKGQSHSPLCRIRHQQQSTACQMRIRTLVITSSSA